MDNWDIWHSLRIWTCPVCGAWLPKTLQECPDCEPEHKVYKMKDSDD